jgi:hypothetical protein
MGDHLGLGIECTDRAALGALSGLVQWKSGRRDGHWHRYGQGSGVGIGIGGSIGGVTLGGAGVTLGGGGSCTGMRRGTGIGASGGVVK